MTDHVRQKCVDQECCGNCSICNLFVCSVCGGAEGSLSDKGCCGYRLTEEVLDAIYAGRIGIVELERDRAKYELGRGP